MGEFYIWPNDEHTDWIYFASTGEIYVIGFNPEDGWGFFRYTKEEAKRENISRESWILGPKYPLKKADNISRKFIRMFFEMKNGI